MQCSHGKLILLALSLFCIQCSKNIVHPYENGFDALDASNSLITCNVLNDDYVLYCPLDSRLSCSMSDMNQCSNLIYMDEVDFIEREGEIIILVEPNLNIKHTMCDGYPFVHKSYYETIIGTMSGGKVSFDQNFTYVDSGLQGIDDPIYIESCRRIFNEAIYKENRMREIMSSGVNND